jgi:hypothetical protein
MYEKKLPVGKIHGHLSSYFSPLPYYISHLQPEQRNLLDESTMIRTQMGDTIDQKMVAAAWDALYDTTL